MGIRVRAALLAVLLVAGVAYAEDRFEQVPVAGTAVGLTAAKIDPPGQRQAETGSCRVRTAQISWTYDGTTPTATVGVIAEIDEVIWIPGHQRLLLFRAIRTGATSGQLDCNYAP